MEEHERLLLVSFLVALVARLLVKLASLAAPVRVPLHAARDAADWTLYAKEGRSPSAKRLRLLLYQLAVLALCVLVWWRLTRVHRAALPLTALAAVPGAPPLVLRLQVVLLSAAPVDAATLLERVAALVADSATPVSVSLVLTGREGCTAHSSLETAAPPPPRWRCDLLRASWADVPETDVDAALAAALETGSAGAYSLVLLPADGHCAAAPTFGAQRHAWARCGIDGLETLLRAAASRFGSGGMSGGPALGGSSEVRLEFSLCNAEPGPGYHFSWDFDARAQAEVARWAAVLKPALTLSSASAVLLHTAAGGGDPTWDGETSRFVVPQADLPLLVNPTWPLHVPGDPSLRLLHLLVWVPPRKVCPLALPADAPGFSLPGWGGVVLWNPPACAANTSGVAVLSAEEVSALMAVFAAQLRTLLGLPAMPAADTLPAPAVFALWEVDALSRAITRVQATAAAETLAALGRVVRELPTLAVPDAIGGMAVRALASSAALAQAAAEGRHTESAQAAAEAYTAAEAAFSHPALLATLHFPMDHALAVYLPLFLPVLMPLSLAAIHQARHYRLRAAFAAAYAEQKGG